MQSPQGYAPPQKSSGSAIWIILACVGGGVVVMTGVLAVLAIYGVRKYVANAKQAEALNTIGALSRSAVIAYEDGAELGAKGLCASASSPVPASMSSVRGVKYTSSPAEWAADSATVAGFACLKFEMSSPQYYQYDYKRVGGGSTPGDQFHAIAHGDLNGDGNVSTYVSSGAIDPSGSVSIDPSPKITNPGE